MRKKIIINLDSSKTFCVDCIPVVVLKNCEPERSYILPEIFKICLKESVFQIVGICFPVCFLITWEFQLKPGYFRVSTKDGNLWYFSYSSNCIRALLIYLLLSTSIFSMFYFMGIWKIIRIYYYQDFMAIDVWKCFETWTNFWQLSF